MISPTKAILLSLCLVLSSLVTENESALGSNQQYSVAASGESLDQNKLDSEACYFADNVISCYKHGNKSKWCDCNGDFKYCEISKKLSKTFLSNFCITYDEKNNLTEIGTCIFVVIQRNKTLTGALCESQFHRTGTLCGKCQEDYYPLAYSYDMKCAQCPNGKSNWWKFVLIALLPLTVFCFIVLLFKINVTSSYLHGYVFYAQTITIPAVMRVAFITSENKHSFLASKYIGSLYSIWNLDFFRLLIPGICLETGTLQTLAIDFLIGIYPLVLLVLTYALINLYDKNFRLLVILWKPFRTIFSLFHSNWEVRTSLIDAFASFLLLANCKVLSVSFDLLIPVKVYHLNSTGHLSCDYRLFLDATIPYFRGEHLRYAILAIVMLVLIVILPLLLLSLYPFRWFHSLLNLIPVRWYILHTFVDSFQGCYKDGTEPGTRDCRWFASIFLLVRLLQFIIATLTLGWMFYVSTTIILVLVVILLITFQPFKVQLCHHSYINAVFFLALVIWNALVVGKVYATAIQSYSTVYVVLFAIFGLLPLLYISAIILHWMYRKKKFGCNFMQRFHAWRHGYDSILTK